jgi:hypothetical protein
VANEPGSHVQIATPGRRPSLAGGMCMCMCMCSQLSE